MQAAGIYDSAEESDNDDERVIMERVLQAISRGTIASRPRSRSRPRVRIDNWPRGLSQAISRMEQRYGGRARQRMAQLRDLSGDLGQYFGQRAQNNAPVRSIESFAF